MEAESFIDFLSSPAYVSAIRALAFLCLIGAAGLTLFCLSQYGRARESGRAQEAPWVLIMATWRDSFLLTLLYTAEAILYRAVDARSGLMVASDAESFLLPLISMYGGIVLQFLIALIAVLRVLALSKWLRTMSGAKDEA